MVRTLRLLAGLIGGVLAALPPAAARAAASPATAPAPAAPLSTLRSLCLNGEAWTFQAQRLPFFGFELDAPGRWKPAQRSHRFIVEALADPAIDWERRHPVRVPMSWSCATSEPGARAALGDFPFPAHWQYVHRGCYERDFTVPASFRGGRLELAFASVNFRCWIYVNGTLVRGADGTAFTHENKHPFALDITDLVRPDDGPNRLRVLVQDHTAAFAGAFPNEDHPENGITYPLGDRCDYYNKDRGWRNLDSGIIGDVFLHARPAVQVRDVVIRTSVRAATIEADVTVRNTTRALTLFRVDARVTAWRDGAHALAWPDGPALTLEPGETRTLTLRQPWAEPHLWWPHDPFLYRLTVQLTAPDGHALCTHDERFGFREVALVRSRDADQRGFYLNGVRTRLYGESVEPTWKDGYTEGVGTSGLYLYNPAYWSALLDEAKRLGITVLRTHRGLWVPQLFEIADEKGMLMIAESTINNGNHQGGNGTLENQRRALRDLIVPLRNHPSIVLWSLANESPWHEAWGEEAARHDRTRPCVATQTKPRHHPSPYLAAATGSYALGLSGYEPNIYGRHDANWTDKPMYIYEDNACYDQPGDDERLHAVQQGLTIFRGHRSSGYEIVCTFYTWQKVYGQPQRPEERLLRITWRPEELTQPGYHPAQARLPLLDPWTDRAHPRVLRPLTAFADPPAEFWRRSFSPVAVFDRAHDERLDVAANPYVAPFAAARTLLVHNDDLVDRTTAIVVRWTVQSFDGKQTLSTGRQDVVVPLGGLRRVPIVLACAGHDAVRVTYVAEKSGRECFRETIALRGAPPPPATASTPAAGAAAAHHSPVPTGGGQPAAGDPAAGTGSSAGSGAAASSAAAAAAGEIFLRASDADLTSKGYQRTPLGGSFSPVVLEANPASPADYVEFHPAVAVSGEYHLYYHVVPGLHGSQGIEIRHDTLNTTLTVDLTQRGWVRATASPLHLTTGSLQNVVRIGRGGTTKRSVVDALKLVREPDPAASRAPIPAP